MKIQVKQLPPHQLLLPLLTIMETIEYIILTPHQGK